jgi:hypothetical protein
MNPVLTELKAALDEYYRVIPLQKEPNPPDLLEVFRKLDAVAARLDASVHPQLRHYMESKSYRKAWLFLQGPETAGNPRS